MKYKGFVSSPTYSNAEKIYYGSVDDVPEISEIEAGTLEEYERRFHDVVDEYQHDCKYAKPSKKLGLIITVVAIAGLLLAMALSCPKKTQHTEALTDMVTSLINESVEDDEFLTALSALFSGSISKLVINNSVEVDDYFLFSVGKFEYEGKSNVVSVGVLGHVFIVSKGKIKKELKQNNLL